MGAHVQTMMKLATLLTKQCIDPADLPGEQNLSPTAVARLVREQGKPVN
jgi:hypothetical protein